MTLDLAKVSTQIEDMGEQLLEDHDVRQRQLDAARSYFRVQAPHWEALAALAQARPVGSAAPTEPLDASHACPPVPGAYEVVASDGSTVEPDRHGPALCALVNVGQVRIRYGIGASATLESQPSLYFRERDLYVDQGGRRVLLRERYLDAWRSIAEMAALATLAGGDDPSLPRVGLADGLLLLWNADWNASDDDILTPRFREALDRIAEQRLPLAAYISRPTSHWIVDLLREAALCRNGAERCELRCADRGCAFARLGDADLFDFLQPGARSGLFMMTGPSADRFGESNRAHFFYLNVGRELARIEVPAWVAQDAGALELLHTIICDQADRGIGYPVALARAHEQAVLSGYDRRILQQLIVGALTRRGFATAISEKQTSKNVRAV
jgi:hypothetical protein